jgi:hypothetical protein
MRQCFWVSALAVLAVLGVAEGTARGTEAFCYLGNVLPAGSYRAETFSLGVPKELAGVQAKFAEAVAKKQEFFQAYVAKLKLKPGEPLPFCEEMGMAREDYEALTKAYANPGIIRGETIDVQVDCSNGSMRFRAKQPNDFVSQVQVDAKGTLSGSMNLVPKP